MVLWTVLVRQRQRSLLVAATLLLLEGDIGGRLLDNMIGCIIFKIRHMSTGSWWPWMLIGLGLGNSWSMS